MSRTRCLPRRGEVLLHGGSQNAHTWDTVAMALDRPLVAIDLPGHGHSDGPGDRPEGQLDAHGNAEAHHAGMYFVHYARLGGN